MKAVEGVALLAGAAIGEAVAPELSPLWLAAATGGASLVVEGIAQALEGSQGNFSIRQAASPCQAIYGMTRTGGTIVWTSTTGSNQDYLHVVIVWACHACASIETLYVDGKQVYLDGNNTSGSPLSGDNAVLNMQSQPTAGNALNRNYQDINGNTYNWGGSICVYNHLGGASSVNPFVDFLTPNDPTFPAESYFNGLTATYIKFTYNSNRFSGGIPEIRAVIRGKTDIYDPRDESTGYSQNMALCIANVLCDTTFGAGCILTPTFGSTELTEIDIAQLTAAANACDEQVNLAAGGTETRYECNGTFATNSSPGDIVQSMLDSCAGRLTYTAGLFGIFPGVWLGDSGAAVNPPNVVGPVSYTAVRKYRDLINLCQGTFICPVYPYATGYSYDYQDPELEVFNGCFQPTNFPYWTDDTLHGYDAEGYVGYIEADGNRTLIRDIKLQFVLSVSTAQRIAKINVLRNRYQSTLSLPCSLAVWNVTAMDNIEVNFPVLGLSGTEFEVQSFKFVARSDPGRPEDAPTLSCELALQATDSSVYDWSTSEELGILITASPTIYDAFQIAGATDLVLTSGAGTAFVNEAGIVTGRIKATWEPPGDSFVTYTGFIEVQWQEVGDAVWNSSGQLQGSVTQFFCSPCLSGQQYNVRVRAGRAGGVYSDWLELTAYTVSTLETTIDAADVFYADGSTVQAGQIKTLDDVHNGVTYSKVDGTQLNGSGELDFSLPYINKGALAEVDQADTANIVSGAVNSFVAYQSVSGGTVGGDTSTAIGTAAPATADGFCVLTATVILTVFGDEIGSPTPVVLQLLNGTTVVAEMDMEFPTTESPPTSLTIVGVDTAPEPSTNYSVQLTNNGNISTSVDYAYLYFVVDQRKV